MKLQRKHIVLGLVAVLGVSLMSYASAKKEQAKRLFGKVQFGLAGFGKIGMKLPTTLWFDMDVSISNPTAEDFYISSGGAVAPKVLRLYQGTQQIGFGAVEGLHSLNLPAGGRTTIKNIRVNLDLLNTGGILYEAYKEYKLNFSQYLNVLQKLRFELDIDGMGNIYTLEHSFA